MCIMLDLSLKFAKTKQQYFNDVLSARKRRLEAHNERWGSTNKATIKYVPHIFSARMTHASIGSQHEYADEY